MVSMVAPWSGKVLMVPATENLKEARDGAIGGAAVGVGFPKGRRTEGRVDAAFALDGGCLDLDPDPGKLVRDMLWKVGQMLALKRRSGSAPDGLRRGGGGGMPDLVGGDGGPDSDPGRRLLFPDRKAGGGAVVWPVGTATVNGGCGVKGGGGVGRREEIRVGGEMGLIDLGPYGSLMEGCNFGLGKVIVGEGRPNKEKEGISLQVQETGAPALGE